MQVSHPITWSGNKRGLMIRSSPFGAMSHFPFLKLPLELRMMIYELVMGDHWHGNDTGTRGYRVEGPILGKTTSRTRSGKEIRPLQDRRAYQNATPVLAIAFTCRELYREVIRIWYRTVKFTFRWAERMDSFMDTMTTPNLKAIRYIRLYVGINYNETLEADHRRMVYLLFEIEGLRMLDFDIGSARGTWRWKKFWALAGFLLRALHSVQRITLLGSFDWKRKAETSNGVSRFLQQATIMTLDERSSEIREVHTYA